MWRLDAGASVPVAQLEIAQKTRESRLRATSMPLDRWKRASIDYSGRTRSGPVESQSGQRPVSSATVPQVLQSTR